MNGIKTVLMLIILSSMVVVPVAYSALTRDLVISTTGTIATDTPLPPPIPGEWTQNVQTGFEELPSGQIPHYNELVPSGFAGWDVIPGDINILSDSSAYAGSKYMRGHTPSFSGETMFALVQYLGWASNVYDTNEPPPLLYSEVKASWYARLVTMPTSNEYLMFFWYAQGKRTDGSVRGYLWSGRMQLAYQGEVGFYIDRMYINGDFATGWAPAPALADGDWHRIEALYGYGAGGYYEYRVDGGTIFRREGDTTPFGLSSEGVAETYQPRGFEVGIWSRSSRDYVLHLDEVVASWKPS